MVMVLVTLGGFGKGLFQQQSLDDLLFKGGLLMICLFLSWTKGLTQVRTSASIKQLALNMHIKHI